jgi:Mrp family chromosome partitioning ATPase
VARGGHTKMENAKSLVSILTQLDVDVVGAVLNQY